MRAGGSNHRSAGLLLLCCSAAMCSGQQIKPVILPVIDGSDIRFSHVFSGTGPAHSRAHSVVQDPLGFLWFATADRLQRYDGYDVREFRQPLNDPNVFTQSLFKDRSGTLWAARDRGIGRDKVPFGSLDRYDPATGTFTPVPRHNPWFQAPISDISQDRAGALWFSTSGGLIRMDPATGQTVLYQHNPDDPFSLSSNAVRSTLETKDGSLWVAMNDGLDLFDRTTAKVIQRIPLPGGLPANNRPDVMIIHLCEDHAGVLWAVLSYGYGLARIDRETGKFVFYSLDGAGTDNTVRAGARAIREDRNGALWIGTVFSGILRLEPDRTRFIHYHNNPADPESLGGDAILDLFEDREGNMWVATNDAGVDRFPTRPLPFKRYRHEIGNPNSLDTSYTTTVFEDSQGILWVGSRRALGALDRKTGQMTFYRKTGGPAELSDAWILSVVEDRSGYLWFGSQNGGLNRFDRRTGRFKAYRPPRISDDRLYRLLLDHAGVLWIGTEKGLDAFDPVTEKSRPYLNGMRIRDIAEDSHGMLWIAARATGLVRLDPSTGQSTVYHPSSDKVWAVTIDHEGILWLATENGLNRFDPATQTFTTYYESDGLPDNSVSHIMEDESGDLWISTHNGLSRFNRKTFQNYYFSDGLSGNEFYDSSTSFKTRSGEMFFSANGGMTAFFPREIVDDTAVPPVMITDFKIFGKDSPLKASLSHSENVLTFEFSSLSFTSPERNRYRYRLEPLETQWNESQGDRRSITYALAPGEYTFRVQGSNSRDVWNVEGATARFVISPPWWNTWAFRALVIVMLLALIGYGYHLHLQNIQRQFKIRFDERTRIARELHDTLLQSFHGLLLRFQAVDHMLPPGKAKETLEKAIDQAAQAITESRDAVQELRASTVLTNDLPGAITAVGEALAADSLVAFRVDVQGTPRNLQPILRDEVYRIAAEALRNAFRHADASCISLEIQYADRELRLLVRDDGKGIGPNGARKNGHFGLTGMRERAALLGGTLEIWSELDEGTEVGLTVPLVKRP
ncbi:MAG TPA: two-component regulator propeller domain-containing protein [Bryobacteraceae bacterium]|nr:two-component regulator propeller domain-containing protein [Bryobacteraceae bacterium]